MAIQFVGGATASKGGATSGNTTIALDSGLTGGIDSAVAAGDLVIAVFASASTADRTLSITDGTDPYTLVNTELYGSDDFDINLRVTYKFMGGTPDTDTTFGPTGNNADAGAMAVYVFRGVDSTTPLDVSAVSGQNTGTSRVVPPDITPSTAGAFVVVAGGAAHNGGVDTFTSSDLTDFLTIGQNDNNDVTLGIGHQDDWTSGATNYATWGHTQADSASFCWAAITLALRPIDGATFNDDVDETAAVADAPSVAATFASTRAETNAIADAPSVLATFAASGTESVAVADAPSATFNVGASVAETPAVADTPSATVNTSASRDETVAVADTVTGGLLLTASTAESAAAAETQSVLYTAGASDTETVTVAESQQATAQMVASRNESAAVADAPSAVFTAVASRAESSAVADAPSAQAAFVATVGESTSIADAQDADVVPGGGDTFNDSVAEDAAAAESQSALAVFAPSVAESQSSADAPSAQAVFAATMGETVSISDAPSAQAVFAATMAESVAVADTQDAEIAINGSVSETITVADSCSATVVRTASVAETAEVLDALSAPGSIYNASVAETLNAVDQVSVFEPQVDVGQGGGGPDAEEEWHATRAKAARLRYRKAPGKKESPAAPPAQVDGVRDSDSREVAETLTPPSSPGATVTPAPVPGAIINAPQAAAKSSTVQGGLAAVVTPTRVVRPDTREQDAEDQEVMAVIMSMLQDDD